MSPQPPPGRTPARAKFAASAAKHRSPPQPPKPPKPPRSPQDDSMEAIGLMVEQCHVAREEGDDDQVVAALLPLLNAARHQGDDVVKALADAALKGSKPRLLASLEVAATVAARGADEVVGDGGVSTEEDAVVNVARACERLAFLDLADDATDALGTALAAAAHRRANHATLEIRGAIPAEENSVHAHATGIGERAGCGVCRRGRRPSLYGVGRSAVRESRRKTITNRCRRRRRRARAVRDDEVRGDRIQRTNYEFNGG